MPSKKDKKYARENVGIPATVNKLAAAKLPSGDGTSKARDRSSVTSNKSSTASEASSPPVNTPEIRPSLSGDGNHVTASPLLEALSTTSASPNIVPSLTTEWAKTVMAGSPSNLINLTSESPPTQPSSYEDTAKPHNGWAAAHRPFMSPSPASLSPPSSNRRPLSFLSDTQNHMTGTPPRSTSAAYRRSSLYSQFTPSQAPGSHQPPLPHQQQAHFYGAQNLDLTITPHSGMKAGDHGYFSGFDSLPIEHGSTNAEKVVLAGYQGGLQVHTVSKKGIELVSSLRGLRGGVHYAKILPWTFNKPEPANFSFPLVAVVVHGPVLPSRSTADVDDGRLGASDATPDSNANLRPGYGRSEAYPASTVPPIQLYQTSVEVYSLKTNKLVDVLLQAPTLPINTEVSLLSPLFQPPSPSGAFNIKADAGTVVIGSGVTGECWIYRQLLEPQNGHMFACTGKIWTTIQQGFRTEIMEVADRRSSSSSSSAGAQHLTPRLPIFSLNGRWIAYCPPNPSSQASLRAHIPVPLIGRAPGVATMAPPHLPLPSTAVDLPISDSVMNKFMRETAQEFISGMKWVGQQGLQAWNSYWSQPPNLQAQQPQVKSSRALTGDTPQFPPTHATTGSASASTSKDPGLVSILDVNMLPVSNTVHPLATFATPLGCSFIAFSPSSLALFTASTKGDVQTVWDLLRLQHTNSSPLQTTLAQHETLGPQVRQIAQFSRMTVARIVEVAWSEPHGDRLAMVTERGTIHFLDMPFSSFMWPPPRRRKVAQSSGIEAAEQPGSAVSIASGAIGVAFQVAKPFVSRSRRGSSSAVSPSAGTTLRDSAAQGGRVIAASISHSLGKTGTAISQLRHTGDNRVSLPSSSTVPSAACVSWFRGRRSQSLYSIGGGIVRIFPCKTTRGSTSAPGKRILRTIKYKDLQIHLLPDDVIAPLVRQTLELGAADEYLELSEADMDAGNTLTLNPSRTTAGPRHVLVSTIPQAEIESSAPYQPFHTDRRVSLCEYSRVDSASVPLANTNLDDKLLPFKKKKNQQGVGSFSIGGEISKSAWTFGQEIFSVQLDLGVSLASDDDFIGPEDHMALPQSAIERVMQYGGAEQIVVTTRRRRGGRQVDRDEDGFFEDDCEVLDFADQRV